MTKSSIITCPKHSPLTTAACPAVAQNERAFPNIKQIEGKLLVLNQLKRPHKPKVRTGCITCKYGFSSVVSPGNSTLMVRHPILTQDRIRRVKCDEAKPACLKCTSTGRTCDGYAPPRALLFEISKDERERRSFHYFRECTAPELRGDTRARFWDGFVLRVSYFQEGIRHAIAAMGALHESLELQTGRQALAARSFAFELHSKAIIALTRRTQAHSTEDVLIACILFTWFENLQGNFNVALSHLKSGLNILGTWRANLNLQLRQPAVSAVLIRDDLAPMLDRLKLQAQVFLRSPDQPNPVIHDSSLPERFSDIAQAHRYFYQIIHWTCRSVQVETKSQGQGYVHTKLIPQIVRKLNDWLILLEHYVQECSRTTKAEMSVDRYWRVKDALHLKMQHQNAIIMLKALPYDRETKFDDQLPHFSRIVALGREFLDEGDRIGTDLKHTVGFGSFDHDHSIIPSLFLTASRCRDPHVRRQAISLLRRYHWKEDIWDSDITASLAERLMLLEEINLGEIHSCKDVPDSSRLYMVACTFYAYNRAENQLQL